MRKKPGPKKLRSRRMNRSSSLEKSSLTPKLKLILIKHSKE